MKKFEIKGNVTLRIEGTIEAESEDEAWDSANDLIESHETHPTLTVTECVDAEVYDVYEVKDKE